MTFFPIPIAHAIQGVVDMVDIHLRDQLRAGVIVNERDYCSSFTVLFRTLMRALGVVGLEVECRINADAVERTIGADLMFRFHRHGRYKVLMAEAKLVRSRKPSSWDYLKSPKKNPQSHFDRQLLKQAAHIMSNPGTAFIEVFFLDAPLGTKICGLRPYGSTCFRHKDAVSHRFHSSLGSLPLPLPLPTHWTRHDLSALAAGPHFSLGEAVFHTCRCSWGEALDRRPVTDAAEEAAAFVIDVRFEGQEGQAPPPEDDA
jgi:hypothetical protein